MGSILEYIRMALCENINVRHICSPAICDILVLF